MNSSYSTPRLKKLLQVSLCSLSVLFAHAAENMIGRQSQNEGMQVVPAPGPVTVDGDLQDWDTSGRIWCFADQALRNRYSCKIASMWNAKGLYLAFIWRDPTPLYSSIDPAFSPQLGWRSDSVQIRAKSADRTAWFTTWYYTAKSMPCLHIEFWKDDLLKTGTDQFLYYKENNQAQLGDGYELAYQVDADEQGYVQEMFIPWERLFKNPPAIQPGLKIQLGFELLWGDPTGGQAHPIHRYADNVQAGETRREFFWTNTKIWGDVVLLPKGNIQPRHYVSDEKRIEGFIKVRAEVPKSAARMTLVIEDEKGNRIRNLVADILPEDYQVAENETSRTVEIGWDALDDHGKLVPAGNYRVRGLHHGGLGADYEMTFYNPGTPPWSTRNGRGDWGADHVNPSGLAQAGDTTIITWTFAEGGSGMLGVGADGFKKWGETRGARAVTGDNEYVYSIPRSWYQNGYTLMRIQKENGAYAPYSKNGKELPLEYPFEAILGTTAYQPEGLAATDSDLVVLLKPTDTNELHRSAIVRLDKATTALRHPPIKTQKFTRIATTPQGSIYGMDEQKLYQINPQNGVSTPLTTPGLVKPTAFTLDRQGNLVVMDEGPDRQIKVFSPQGQLIGTCGKKGGRPIRGRFESDGLRAANALSVDTNGYVWVAENTHLPRRVSVWNPQDGKLVRDYIGNANYAASGCYLHDSDPTLAYVGPIELKLNKEDRSWEVTRILWEPNPDVPGEMFPVPLGFAAPQRFSAVSNGEKHEFLFMNGSVYGTGDMVLYMETKHRGWQPVSAITYVGRFSGKLEGHKIVEEPSGDYEGYHFYDSLFWNDMNGDGKVQRNECHPVKRDPPRRAHWEQHTRSLPSDSGWGGRMGTDFVFYGAEGTNLVKYAPTSFHASGFPIYGPKGMTKMEIADHGDIVPVPEENKVMLMCMKGHPGPTRQIGFDSRGTGKILWQYPNIYTQVHGSHRATMPEPGLLIGTLKIMGVAHVNDHVGRVFAMRGNLGQDFYMTTDGLYIGAMFQDVRIPGDALPPDEASLIGRPMENYSVGGEPFSGWFGKQADGKIRVTTGIPRQACMVLTIKGLDSIQRFTAKGLSVSADVLAAADRDNIARAAAATPAKDYTVQPMASPVLVDGRYESPKWKEKPVIPIERVGNPIKGEARLSYDATNLYVAYQIQDQTPWMNEGKDYLRLFKTGDAVDLQLCTDAQTAADANRREPGPHDVRVLLSQLNNQPVAILMKAKDPTAEKSLAHDYISPVMSRHFDRVEIMTNAVVKVHKMANQNRYWVEAALPLKTLGLEPAKGLVLRGDVGFISSDADGKINVSRTYWSNKDTNLVNDMPSEAWFNPADWGIIRFE